MPQPLPASALRIALIDDDSGMITVLDRRFAANRWDSQVIGYAADPEQLTALKLHALIVNPAITGLGYIEWVAERLPGLALLVCSRAAPVADRVRALRAGADDWITKPCHPEELVARIEAVLRRRRAGDLPDANEIVTAGELAIRPDRFDAYANGTPATLSRKEYELLAQLAGAGGRVLEREDIYQRVWGYTMARGDRSVDVFVRKLRQKLEAISPEWRYVHTHFGVGYRFAAERADGTVPESAPRAAARLSRAPGARARRGPSDAGGRGTAYAVGMNVSPAVRNVAIIAVIAAMVAILPGGGTGANVVLTALYLLFLGAGVWVATVMYREHRGSLYLLPDSRRALLYIAIGVLAVTLTATHRLWNSPAGSVAWLVLVGASVYVGCAVIWAARRD